VTFRYVDPYLLPAAEAALSFCRTRFGSRGLRIEQQINNRVGWRPTFWLRASGHRIVAVEVSASPDPEVLKGASSDILTEGLPVIVIFACPTEVYALDRDLKRVNRMRERGFGILTARGSTPLSGRDDAMESGPGGFRTLGGRLTRGGADALEA